MKKQYRIRIKANIKNIDVLIIYVKNILEKESISKEYIDEILISLDEAITNIVMHAYKSKRNGYIKFIMKVSKKKVEISLLDNGKSFKPENVPAPDFKKGIGERKLGGLGIFLMKRFMDKIEFYLKSEDHHRENELKMIKYL